MLNVYGGVARLDENGEAWVEMPEWFDALNRDCRYQLTAIGKAAPGLHVAREVEKGRFQIAGGLPSQRISWQVTGVRQDAWAERHRIPVEEAKEPELQGLLPSSRCLRSAGCPWDRRATQ